ncbi:hypothetical protein K227x_29070 [Rubripirellula lacrimiformis]|uniref:Caspase domain protein n=1 Tax=Rubripirellula lacrimiformis TaxID=1930273 RepID=A0A517NBJ9_9BACT|nr:hypothetical protein [Rubripirellula lacrimiformis]QDT04515.1 hypothetical protein K227x_29070 [Rubripirellula lacrimiformis]
MIGSSSWRWIALVACVFGLAAVVDRASAASVPIQNVSSDDSDSDTTPTESAPVEAKGDQPAPDQSAPDGPQPDGPETDGPAPDGPEPDGPETDGPAPDGPEPDGPGTDKDEPATSAAEGELPAAANRPAQILLVVGASGTEEYEKLFSVWSQNWERVAKVSQADLTVIGGATGVVSSLLQSASELNDRDRVQQFLAKQVDATTEPLWIVIIGHGTFARDVAKFNLVGPDFSARELASWLDPIERPLVIVNTSSSSAPFINRLSKPGRVIVTATKSGSEMNFARFGEFFSSAFLSLDSDLDHDDEVSVHEAFLNASGMVRKFYESESRIATEHALIDDNGDGKGTLATMFRGVRPDKDQVDVRQIDGQRGMRITLSPNPNGLKWLPDELKQRDQIELELDKLREQKNQLSEDEYFSAIEPLMVRLARLYHDVESRATDNSP